jgi:hypothetical protein
MRLLIPRTDELFKLRAQVGFCWNIRPAQTLALQDAEPLFDVMPPRTRHGCAVHHQPRRLGEPSGDVLAMRRTDRLAHQMNRPAGRGNLPVSRVEEGDACLLAWACITVPLHLAGTGVTGRDAIERPAALVRRRVAIGQMTGRGWPGRGEPGPGLQGEVFSSTERPLSSARRGRVSRAISSMMGA